MFAFVKPSARPTAILTDARLVTSTSPVESSFLRSPLLLRFSPWLRRLPLAMFFAACVGAQAQERYGLSAWVDDVKATRLESGVALTYITVLGIKTWGWGEGNSFHVTPEGWFGADTLYGGADKLGHAYVSFALTNLMFERIVREGRTPERAALSAALIGQAIMFSVEIFDGLSRLGFSPQDVMMNVAGASLAYFRAVNPRLRDLVDYRLEYRNSGHIGFAPESDYSGQKYLLALKLGGFDGLRDTPLRFLELQAGYYTRGFLPEERDLGLERSRHAFIGVGVNLTELLLGRRSSQESTSRGYGRLLLEHVQIPFVAVQSARGF